MRQEDEARFAAYRRDIIDGRVTLPALAGREQLRLALDALAGFAHWVTPAVEPRRFDTHFFFAVLPGQQAASHDDHEATRGDWLYPGEAIARCRAGDIVLPPPTWTTLRWLSRFATVAEAATWARTRPFARVEPCFRQLERGARMVMLPGDPLCPPVEGFEAQETRFLLENGRWTPIPP
jgi:hypothetical protein